MKCVVRLSENFWRRWRSEYLTGLREFHRHQKTTKGVQDAVTEGKVVTVYENGTPRGLWRLGRIERVIVSHYEKVRSAVIRVCSKTGHCTTLKQPIHHLYPLEVGLRSGASERSRPDTDHVDTSQDESSAEQNHDQDDREVELQNTRPCRKAAIEARDLIVGCLTD